MAINIGSNFLYQGKQYLDGRVGKAKTIEDLKNWNIPIPDGFEVFLNGSWYTYNSNNTVDIETGKFRRRSEVTQEFGDNDDISISQAAITSRFDSVDNSIAQLTAEIFPLEFKTIKGGGSYEVGAEVTPEITWTVGIKGKTEELQPSKATVNDSTTGIATNLKSWTGSVITLSTPGSKSYKVVVESGLLKAEKTVSYSFYYRKYYGTSTSSDITPAEVLKLNKAFVSGTSYTMSATKFDCTGGKYPYYIIPKSIYKSTLEMWVGGLKNTDLVIKDIDVITETGLKITYTTIRLANIQTGNLSIEIK